MLKDKALLCDLYQLTMAQAYWNAAAVDTNASTNSDASTSTEACFYMHFRENPFRGGYAIACGFAQFAEFVEGFRFTEEQCAYLATLKTPHNTLLFEQEFINTLAELTLSISVDAVVEGTAIFPYEPIARVTGPILHCQLIETALLNLVNYQTLIATKAARICEAAKGPVAEFGLRRAQGPMGGLLASRAAVVGGCASTSNVEAGQVFGLPVSGTHAHSWVMAHTSELAAFRAFAAAFPHNSVLLVDTYDTLGGVRNAITVAKEMEQRGEKLLGIRIDSGDLAWLSIRARELLDEADLSYVKIVASNDLDEHTIQSLREQGACIDSWGVGTKLVTAWDQPALTGVYKLCATRAPGEERWTPQLKVSEQIAKSTLPGLLATRRYLDEHGAFIGDMIYNTQTPPTNDLIIDPFDELRRKDLSGHASVELLQPLIRMGKVCGAQLSALEAQNNTRESLRCLDASKKRLLNPHVHPVGLETVLHQQRDEMILRTRSL
jgi:nicotinate phosphoribosyltransferase